MSRGHGTRRVFGTTDALSRPRRISAVETSEDLEAIEQLRYKAYKAANVLPVAVPSMIDDADFDPHAFVFGIYYFEELVSTIRLHHVTPQHTLSQSAGVFPDVMDAYLEAGLTLIDPARFAVDPAVAAEMPVLPYIHAASQHCGCGLFQGGSRLAACQAPPRGLLNGSFMPRRLSNGG